jgi:hypothetical protein
VCATSGAVTLSRLPTAPGGSLEVALDVHFLSGARIQGSFEVAAVC